MVIHGLVLHNIHQSLISMSTKIILSKVLSKHQSQS